LFAAAGCPRLAGIRESASGFRFAFLSAFAFLSVIPTGNLLLISQAYDADPEAGFAGGIVTALLRRKQIPFGNDRKKSKSAGQ
jgi:hypothetical protein